MALPARVTALALGLGASALGLAVGAPSPAFAAENEKAGPWSASFKVGPAIEASTRASTQLALQLEIAHAIVGDEGYLGFAPQLQLVDETAIVLPVSFQYDVHLPVENLSVYPRIEAGLAMAPGAGAYGFALQPEIGVKWQVHQHAHLVLEPISLPMTFGDPVLIQVRIFAGAGADF